MAMFSGSARSPHFRFRILLCVLGQVTNPFAQQGACVNFNQRNAILATQKVISPNELRLTANNPHGTVKKTK